MRNDSLFFLVGARASGKSSLGRMLAERLGFAFRDTDRHIRDACGLDVDAIVDRGGWPAFRARECAALRECACPRAVVATGGGMVLDPLNRAFMRDTGTVFFLDVPARVLAERLAAQPLPAQRPSLTGLPPAEEMERVLAEREPLYRETAHHVVQADRPLPELARELERIARATLHGEGSSLGFRQGLRTRMPSRQECRSEMRSISEARRDRAPAAADTSS